MKVSSPIREALMAHMDGHHQNVGWSLHIQDVMLPGYNLCKRDELSKGSSSIQRHTGQDFQAADKPSNVQNKRMKQRREDRHLPMKSKEKSSLEGLQSDWQMLQVSCCQA